MYSEHNRAQENSDTILLPGRDKWKPLLAEPLRGQALEAASLVAEQLRNPDHLLTIAEMAAQQSALPPAAKYPVSNTFGFIGGAFPATYLARCFPEQGWDRITHRYLNPSGLSSLVFANLSLFGGASGLAMIMTLMSEEGKRYRKTLANLHTCLLEQVKQAAWFLRRSEGIAEGDYDLIRGASGILAYLLFVPTPDAAVQATIEILLDWLIHLASTDQESKRERWHVAQQFIILEESRQRYPDGYYNCGLAHGIPGPLAVLSLAWLAGYRTPGLQEAVRFLSDWIVQHALVDPWGITWSDVVPLEHSHSAEAWQTLSPARTAWCYGTPGIARALWLAGKALEDALLCQTAIEAMEAVLRRPIAERRINSPTVCHGIAGLLAICLRFAQEIDNTTIREQIPVLVSQIMSHYNPDFPLGFRDLEPGGNAVDQTVWLTGAPGTMMVLLAASLPVEPAWDRVLLLS